MACINFSDDQKNPLERYVSELKNLNRICKKDCKNYEDFYELHKIEDLFDKFTPPYTQKELNKLSELSRDLIIDNLDFQQDLKWDNLDMQYTRKLNNLLDQNKLQPYLHEDYHSRIPVDRENLIDLLEKGKIITGHCSSCDQQILIFEKIKDDFFTKK